MTIHDRINCARLLLADTDDLDTADLQATASLVGCMLLDLKPADLKAIHDKQKHDALLLQLKRLDVSRLTG